MCSLSGISNAVVSRHLFNIEQYMPALGFELYNNMDTVKGTGVTLGLTSQGPFLHFVNKIIKALAFKTDMFTALNRFL